MAELDPNYRYEPSEVPEPSRTYRVTRCRHIPPNRPRKVYAGMWGPLEIVAVSLGALAVLAAFLVYFFFVMPSNRELARNKSEADRLEAELISAKSKYGEITSTETQVGKLLASVDDFETRFLPVTTNGQAALYQRLNGLIAAYGLINTTGPDYAPLEPAEHECRPANRRGTGPVKISQPVSRRLRDDDARGLVSESSPVYPRDRDGTRVCRHQLDRTCSVGHRNEKRHRKARIQNRDGR